MYRIVIYLSVDVDMDDFLAECQAPVVCSKKVPPSTRQVLHGVYVDSPTWGFAWVPADVKLPLHSPDDTKAFIRGKLDYMLWVKDAGLWSYAVYDEFGELVDGCDEFIGAVAAERSARNFMDDNYPGEDYEIIWR